MPDTNLKKKILSALKALDSQTLSHTQHSTQQASFASNQHKYLRKPKRRVSSNSVKASTITRAVDSLNNSQAASVPAPEHTPSLYEQLPQPEIPHQEQSNKKHSEDYKGQLLEVMHGIVVQELNAQVEALTSENEMLKSQLDDVSAPSALSSSQVSPDSPEPLHEPQATDDDAYENIPVSQKMLESFHFIPKLESMLESAELSLHTLEEVIRKRLAISKRSAAAGGMTFGYDRDPKNAEFIHQQKVDILSRYVNASKNIMHLAKTTPINSTQILDYLDEVYELSEENYNINIKANTPTNEGPIVNLLSLTKDRMLSFLEKHVVNPKDINKRM